MFDAHQGRRFVHKIGKIFKTIEIIAVLSLVKAFLSRSGVKQLQGGC